MGVEFEPLSVAFSRWNDRFNALFFQKFENSALSKVRFVSDELLRLNFRKQFVSTIQIVALAGCEIEAQGIAQSIAQGVNLCAQSAA